MKEPDFIPNSPLRQLKTKEIKIFMKQFLLIRFYAWKYYPAMHGCTLSNLNMIYWDQLLLYKDQITFLSVTICELFIIYEYLHRI